MVFSVAGAQDDQLREKAFGVLLVKFGKSSRPSPLRPKRRIISRKKIRTHFQIITEVLTVKG